MVTPCTILSSLHTYSVAADRPALLTFIKHQSGGETGVSTLSPVALKFMTYGLPAFSTFIMLSWPAALQLSFTVSAFLGMGQAAGFRSTWIRNWLGISPLPPVPPPSQEPSGSTPTFHFGTLNVDRRQNHVGDAPSDRLLIPQAETKPKGIVGGAVAEVKGMAGEVKKSWNEVTGKTRKPGQRSGNEKHTAQTYEIKRQKEIAQQRWDQEQIQWDRWREKREQKQAHGKRQ